MKLRILIWSLVSSLAGATAAWAEDVTTFVFNDVIASNGRGAIDLFSPQTRARTVSGALLEAFRQDNQGRLVFAVDVNEAASGTETADSQGVAIASAVLSVTIAGQTVQYSDYSTPTRSLLAFKGSNERSEHYTLIGTAGTNRVSPQAGSELTASSLDETLRFEITDSLAGATAARLDIELMETNAGLGDPEAFYDYSNGFEEVALLSRVDVEYLEALAPGRDAAPLVIDENGSSSYSWSYFPSDQGHYLAAYEDLFPLKGDYDFNDLVVAYQVSLGSDDTGAVAVIRGNGYLVARGGSFEHDWRLHIGLPAWASGQSSISVFAADSHTPMPGYPQDEAFVGEADLLLFDQVAGIFADGPSTYVNTFAEQGLTRGPKFEFEILLDTPVPVVQIASAPFDPYLYVHDTNHEVHLVGQSPRLAYSNTLRDNITSFRDEQGFPFALVLPDAWQPPLAGVDMGLAYPELIEHVASNGQSRLQWYMNSDSGRIKPVPMSHWRW